MFTLHEAIRDYLDENDERDPYVIAPAIRHMIPKSQRLVLFDELIAGVVKDVERAMKNEAIRSAENVRDDEPVTVAATTKTARRTGRVANSYKNNKTRHEVYQGLLDMIVGVNGRFRKPFGTCNYKDVTALIAMHQANVDANLAKVAKFGRVTEYLDPDNDDLFVEDIDEDDLIDAMK
jgi:hypothetical protein